ncbi:MAG: hypothetical protein EPO13_05960 [Actinomycetota bacterium]|nr:MAG: hypothetical protein EPO13_05960 [Actinomycetota bacterium]
MELIELDDPYAANGPEVAQLRLAAMAERFQEHREKIPVLGRRAAETGIDAIRSRDDIVPLLFSHTTYKSYPESFVKQGRWDRMTTWLTTLSAVDGGEVDLEGIKDVDEWLDRLAAAGHFVVASSGTSGKSSFLDQSAADIEQIGYNPQRLFGWPHQVPLRNDRIVISLSRSAKGRYRGFYMHQARVRYFAKPGGDYLIDEPVPLADLSRMAALRSMIAASTATPKEVQEFEGLRADAADRMNASLGRLADIVIAHHDEPMLLLGMWPFAYQLVEAARARGVERGDMHPDTVLGLGGGTKGLVLPDDYREQVLEWFAPARQCDQFGMSEISGHAQKCEDGFYHWPPWIEMLIVDESGEKLLSGEGKVTGRLALFDPVYGGRWGGLVTGDKVNANFGRCSCGRNGPTIEDNVTRYGAGSAAGDDKLTCAASVDAYVREAIS